MCCLGAGRQPWPAASGPGWSVVRRNSSCSLLLPENSEVFPGVSRGFSFNEAGPTCSCAAINILRQNIRQDQPFSALFF